MDFFNKKKDFLLLFKNFYSYAHTQFGMKLKIARIDNAKEFSQGETLCFHNEKDICL